MKDLNDHKKQLVNNYYEDQLLHSRERKIFTNICNKKLDKIDELTKNVDDNNSTYTTISTGKAIDFSKK